MSREIFEKCAEIARYERERWVNCPIEYRKASCNIEERILQAAAEYEESKQASWVSDLLRGEGVFAPFRGLPEPLTRAEFDKWYSVHNGKFKDAQGFWDSFWFTFKGKVIA